jgi:hypothetical protein
VIERDGSDDDVDVADYAGRPDTSKCWAAEEIEHCPLPRPILGKILQGKSHGRRISKTRYPAPFFPFCLGLYRAED